MTTSADALTAIKARLAANFTAIEVRWAGDNHDPLPDEPTAFAFCHFVIDGQDLIAFGGGRGRNEFRSDGYLEAIVMTPNGRGAEQGMVYAEQIAAVFRGQRFSGVSCMAAPVSPGEQDPENGNYWRTFAVIDLHFHQTG